MASAVAQASRFERSRFLQDSLRTMAPTVSFLGYAFCVSLLTALVVRNDGNVQAFVPTNQLSKPGHPINSIGFQRNGFLRAGNIESEQQNLPLSSEIATPSSTRTNVTLDFPPFYNLMDAKPGEFIASDTFSCTAPCLEHESPTEHRFRVKLYPKGGLGKDPSSVASKLPALLGSRSEEVVGLYLEYLGVDGSPKNDDVNATFALRLKGRQKEQKFAIEQRAGMRFVSDETDANPNQGDAVQFGFPFLQTPLLKDFVGITDNDLDPTPIQVEAEIFLHDAAMEDSLLQSSVEVSAALREQSSLETSSKSPFNEDIRKKQDGDDDKRFGHDTERVRVGKIVVPVLSGLGQRPQMFAQGTYPGVEYRILRILKDGQERFTSCPGAEYELKPVYPLVAQLERQWPVRVKENDIPKLYTPSMYNTLSAVGSFFTAITGLFTAFLVSQAISLFFIPSKSMDPTMKVGDVLLVDKVSSRLPFGQSSRNKAGDIVLFSPPSELQQIVARSGGNVNSRDLFVKRVAATSGDKVTVFQDGTVEVNDRNVVEGQRDLCEAEPLRLIEKYIEPSQDQTIKQNEVFVMGDCSSVSVDSRVWGPLEKKNIVGKPIIRLWPLERFGKIE